MDKAAVESLLSRFGALLKADDADAMDVLEELVIRLAGNPVTEVLEEISEALEIYDFDQALELFNRIDRVNSK